MQEEGEPAIGNLDDFEIDPLEDEAAALKGKVGITPWDFIEVSDEQIKHEVRAQCCGVSHVSS